MSNAPYCVFCHCKFIYDVYFQMSQVYVTGLACGASDVTGLACGASDVTGLACGASDVTGLACVMASVRQMSCHVMLKFGMCQWHPLTCHMFS